MNKEVFTCKHSINSFLTRKEKWRAVSIYNSDHKLDEIISLLKDVKRTLRFIGVLGSGMLPLAHIMRERGYRVSGYDRAVDTTLSPSLEAGQGGSPIARLRSAGVYLCSHKYVDWNTVSLAVYSLAFDENDAEILAAKSHGIPLISRAQLLGALMSDGKTRISVSGSHGKSTTTAIIDHILTHADKSPTTVSGARLSSGESYSLGSGEIFLAEACEYKDSFLRLCPTHQIVTSVELDHTDYFPSVETYRASFLTACKRAKTVIINRDDAIASSIADELKKEPDAYNRRIITYGESDGCDYRFRIEKTCAGITYFDVSIGDRVYELRTSLMGKFNLYNVTAAVALSDMLGISYETVKEAVAGFRSIERRLTEITVIDGIPVYYDYAHHPTEIEAVITALKERYGTVTAIFRPHTYSRTYSLWNGFISALSKADFTILLDIYPAREKEIDGVNSKRLAESIKGAVFTDDYGAVKYALKSNTGVIVLLGAGDVESIKERLILLGGKE